MATTFTGQVNEGIGSLKYSISDVATSLTLNSGEGADFHQTKEQICVLFGAEYNNPEDDANSEIIKMTLSAGDVFTCTRAQEGTSAQAWDANDKITNILTAGKMTELENAINTAENDIDTAENDIATLETSMATAQTDINNLENGTTIPTQNTAHFQYTETSGTNGKATVSTTWNDVNYNTTVENNITGCSLSGGDVVLPAGTYRIFAWQFVRQSNITRGRLYNVTDAGVEFYGPSTYKTSGGSYVDSDMVPLRGKITIASGKTIRVDIYTQAGHSTGFGILSSLATEIYGEIFIEKL